MEHIVQFAIGIDDEAIRQRIKETGYEQVIRNLVDRAEKSIADRQWNRDSKVNWERLAESAVKRFVEENKEAIINLAAEKMCEKYSRTKVYKEKMEAVFGGVTMDKTNGNTGDGNAGSWNTGDFNSCDFSAGVFCTTEEKIRIFNMPSDLTASEFYASKYYKALCSAPFILTEWIDYTEEEKDTEEKRALGGCLKTYTYEEACANWWEKMREEDKKTVYVNAEF